MGVIGKKQISKSSQGRPDRETGGPHMARSGGDALSLREVRKGAVPGVQEEQESKQEMLASRVQLQKCLDKKSGSPDTSWTDEIPMCPVYYPTKEEFEDPLAYIRTISHSAQPFGKVWTQDERCFLFLLRQLAVCGDACGMCTRVHVCLGIVNIKGRFS